MSRCTATTPALPALARHQARPLIRYAAESADLSDRKIEPRIPQHTEQRPLRAYPPEVTRTDSPLVFITTDA